jgi:ketosteroid isomerase-like protein
MTLAARAAFDRLFPAMLARDRGALAELLDDDVTWHLPPFAKAPPQRGRAAVIEFLCTAGDPFYEPGSLKLVPEVSAVSDDQGVLVGQLTGTLRSGKPYANRYAFAVRFRGARVIEGFELLDSKVLLDLL